uniref:Uncharacterized protein n=1 Tax=Meloidogyne enterolobii TaxID=390850 RepID=A0A6V7WIM9_MELEN|nr:unnamed protein product [Meloidogyne enterolobii]
MSPIFLLIHIKHYIIHPSPYLSIQVPQYAFSAIGISLTIHLLVYNM